MRIRALLIDFDGTMADSIQSLYQIYSFFLDQFGIPPSWEEFESLNGLKIEEITKLLCERYCLKIAPNVLANTYLSRIKEGISYVPFPYLEEALIAARAKGILLAIVTSGPRSLIEKFLEKYDLQNFFQAIITRESVLHGKPNPEGYLLALKMLGVLNNEAYVIEDSTNGLLAAKNAKIPSIQFLADQEKEISPFAFKAVNNFRELAKFILQCPYVGSSITFLPPPSEIEVAGSACYTQKDIEIMDALWEKKKEKTFLFNGPLLFYLNHVDQKVLVRKGEYKEYIAVQSGGLDSINGFAMGVSSLVLSPIGVLLGRRGEKVACNPGYIETVPSGSLATTNFQNQLEEELFEETGLTIGSVEKVEAVSLLKDLTGKTVEIFFMVHLFPKENYDLIASYEYEKFFWIKNSDVLSFLAQHKKSVAPLTETLLVEFYAI